VIEGAILILLEASAREVTARSAWLIDNDLPQKQAAAAGFLAYLDATRKRSVVLSTMLKPILIGASLFRFFQ
jgi:hypothetical protein